MLLSTTVPALHTRGMVSLNLRRPKPANSVHGSVQIVFTGSDGQRYTFLAKPKDDLRKVRHATPGDASPETCKASKA